MIPDFFWKADGSMTPWGYEAHELWQELAEKFHKGELTTCPDEDECVDAVIYKWLKRGDARPLAAYLSTSDKISLRYAAGMLASENKGNLKLKENSEEIPVTYPYKLTVWPKRTGPRPQTEIRDFMLAQQVKTHQLTHRCSADEAQVAVAERHRSDGELRNLETVKKAYKRFAGRNRWPSLLKGKRT